MIKLIVALLLPCSCFSQINYNYKNLVLEGGGIRGVAYAGAISVLEQQHILFEIEKIAGTSSGAIAGVMISVGYNATEIDSIMRSLPVEEFNDGRGGIFGKYRRVKNNYGLYRGEKFTRWIQEVIKYKTGDENFSFTQLHNLHLQNNLYKDFYCTATNLSKQQLEIFSFKNTPDMPLALAVRISGGIPLFFEPIILNNQYQKIEKTDTISFKNYYIDGGLIANYPISIFDTCENNGNPFECDKIWFNTQTLGIKLERPAQIDSLKNNSSHVPPFQINSFKEYMHAFNTLVLEKLNQRYPNRQDEKGRTIYISYGTVPATVRKMTPAEKEMLFNNGVAGVTDFLQLHH